MSNQPKGNYDPTHPDPDETLKPGSPGWEDFMRSPYQGQYRGPWQPSSQPGPYDQRPVPYDQQSVSRVQQSKPYDQQSGPYAQQPPYGPYSSPYPAEPYSAQPPAQQRTPRPMEPYARSYYENPYPEAPAPSPSPQLLGSPRPAVGFGRAIKLLFKNYGVFHGRASRSEYWWTVLFNFLVILVLDALYGMITDGASVFDSSSNYAGMDDDSVFWAELVLLLFLVYVLATLIPNLAVVWRRLHDTDRSGGLYFLTLIPYIGAIIVLVILLLRSHPQAWQRYDTGKLPAAS